MSRFLFFSLVLFYVNSGKAESKFVCDNSKGDKRLSLLFINGVNKNLSDSIENLYDISTVININNDGVAFLEPKNICYNVAYNQTNGVLGYHDFIESLIQKVREIKPDSTAKDIGEYLFKRKVFLSKWIPHYPDLPAKLMELIVEKLVKSIEQEKTSTLNKITTVAKKSLAIAPTLVVSHSQGNLCYDRFWLFQDGLLSW